MTAHSSVLSLKCSYIFQNALPTYQYPSSHEFLLWDSRSITIIMCNQPRMFRSKQLWRDQFLLNLLVYSHEDRDHGRIFCVLQRRPNLPLS